MMGTMTIVAPGTVTDQLTREPVGTGPYVFTSWRPGQDVVLTRFDGYWGDKPEVEKATYIWRSESAVRAAMVATGEADIAPSIAVQDANDPAMDFSYFDSETTNFRIDVALPPLDDVRVRKALNLAIDRDAIRGSILSEDVVPATQFIVPSINGYNPDLKPWPFDPDQARALLAEAKADGVPVDKEIVIIGRLGIHAGVVEKLEAIHAMLQDVGFNVKLQMIEVAEWVDVYTTPFAEDRPPNIVHAMHDNNNGDAVFTAYFKYHSGGAQSALADPRVDALIEQATAAVDPERRKLWQEMFRLVNEEIVADVPLFHMVGYTRVGPRVNFTPSISTNSEIQIAQVTFK
jgi:peptide/nickel transport system substrate-binding protein